MLSGTSIEEHSDAAIFKSIIARCEIAALAAPGFLPLAALVPPCTSRSQ